MFKMAQTDIFVAYICFISEGYTICVASNMLRLNNITSCTCSASQDLRLLIITLYLRMRITYQANLNSNFAFAIVIQPAW